ncbi:MAG: hypothetical protein ACKVP0_08310 [Pirellulaceae bacterium]
MIRSLVTVLIVVTFPLLAGVTLGQERPSEHAMPSEHSEAEHGMHAGHMNEDPSVEEGLAHSDNYIVWIIRAMGWKYTFLLPVSGLLSFALTAAIVIAGKGKTAGAAIVLIVAMPALIGVFGTIEGAVNVAMVLRYDLMTRINGEAISSCLMTTMVGMFLMIPSYLLATVGLTIRALKGDPKP